MAKKTKNRNGSFLYWSAETWAFLTLRLFLGLRFLTAGLGKFNGEDGYAFSNYYDGFVASQLNRFEQSNLPGFLSAPFLHALGYLEIALGILLLLGVKTKYVLALYGLTFVALAFGLMLQANHTGVTNIGIHILITAAALYFVRHNKLELKR